MILNEVTELEDLPECPKYFSLQKLLQSNVYTWLWKGQIQGKSGKKRFTPVEKKGKKELKKKMFSVPAGDRTRPSCVTGHYAIH